MKMMPFESMTMNIAAFVAVVALVAGAVYYFYLKPAGVEMPEIPEMQMDMPMEMPENMPTMEEVVDDVQEMMN